MAKKDWKKHLLRVKQIAEQNLGRVEKTEALTADLQVLEKKVDLFGKVYYNTGKKLQACIQGQGQEAEKRLKKLPENQLAQSLIESSSLLTLDTLLGQIFQISGDGESRVASNRLIYEMSVESKVLQPIHSLLETSLPAIQKHKKTLQKVVLDMDSAKTRFVAAQKQQQAGASSASTAKVDSLRDEYDETCYKVDQCRDQLATEMFQLASKEVELSHILLELVKNQADFHRKALDCLEKRIPQMEDSIKRWAHTPVYGNSLDDHLERTQREIALVVEECVKNLCTLGGLEEEGLFRIAGAANKIKKLKAAFDSEQCADIAEEYDVHCIAGALKLYLRELPDSLMDSSLYPNWMQAAHLPADQRLQALGDVLALLPRTNYNNLRYLIKFLRKLTEFQDINKMSPSNIAIVMGPNLIWPQGESGPSVLTTSTQSAIVEALISNCDYFFPGDNDIDFGKATKDQLEVILEPRRAPLAFSAPDTTPGISQGLSLTHKSLVPLATAPASRGNSNNNNKPEPVTIRVHESPSPEPEAPLSRESSCSRTLLTGTPKPYSSDRLNTSSPSTRSGSESDSNGRYSKSNLVANGDGLSTSSSFNSNSDFGGGLSARSSDIKSRGVTPPPKGPPPLGLHSDVYNTVFALQQLNDGGCWSDYLTQVRTLMNPQQQQQQQQQQQRPSSMVGPSGPTTDNNNSTTTTSTTDNSVSPSPPTNPSPNTTTELPPAGESDRKGEHTGTPPSAQITNNSNPLNTACSPHPPPPLTTTKPRLSSSRSLDQSWGGGS